MSFPQLSWSFGLLIQRLLLVNLHSDTCSLSYTKFTRKLRKRNGAVSESLCPFERREHSNDFLEVTSEEFESVSSLVRGRVKLSDVNYVYKTLWRIFKEEKRKTPLDHSDMHKMGLKVSGATGEAKLKVLRAIKLVKITTKGDVSLS